ncbi:cytochrome P450 [Micromonospora robiginosa]|uniref:Cytochrome P450 n=1 Tax=Micromonospora robiginosa TaxID=2749844 RepID=A0A7L6B490_9ACTN|nr:cytochrome P450 [Micromonospora ferruginea]QLQ36681.1 cytochrome P450 [Micromonospora ferruginea]
MTSSATHPARLPGPSGPPLVGRQLAFLRDPLGFLTRAHRDYGDLVALPLNGGRVVAAFGAAEVAAVYAGLGEHVEISGGGGINLRSHDEVQGRGPLNSTGTEHAAYRKICHRALGQHSLAAYSTVAVEETERLLRRWRPGQVVDLVPEITALTRRIFKVYMFGADMSETAPDADAAVDLYIDLMESTVRRLATTFVPIEIPGLAQRRRLRTATSAIDELVTGLDPARAVPPRHSLAQALLAEVERAGLPPDPRLVREFMLQLHFAGLTSLASALIWALLLLALHPAATAEALAELSGATGGRIPRPEDVKALPYLEAVLNETMRLYPAAAWEFKQTIRATDVGGHLLPAGTTLMLAPWVTQRAERSFADPLTFAPGRFVGRDDYPPGAFEPWGTGERSCIGKMLARNAFRSVVGGIIQRYRLDLAPGQRIEPHPGLLGTRMLPRPGVRVVLSDQDGDTGREVAVVHGSVIGARPGPAGRT